MLLIGLAGGGYLIHRALRPIREISATAQKIATGDLAQRITTSASGSEFGQLVNVLNSTFARLDAAFTQQIRFTADAAHELRTPVSVLLAQVSICPRHGMRKRGTPRGLRSQSACGQSHAPFDRLTA